MFRSVRGFSLVETAVAVVICGTLLATVVPLTEAVSLMMIRDNDMDQAVDVGESVMEQSQCASSLPTRMDTEQTVRGVVYHIETTMEARANLCDEVVRVAWSFRGIAFAIRLETIRI